jgi:hypothetical protein
LTLQIASRPPSYKKTIDCQFRKLQQERGENIFQ